ncbi:hypothetical protein BC835DRAFT_1308422 [Cytidiella melzeri]|nr:hypothetical protein BC835DRAFT_1308422 [Cytidiella melzeri]
MFSSVPASPPHPHEDRSQRRSRPESHFDHQEFGEGDRSLIIPSLMLPSALRPPTAHGHALGRVRILVLGSSAAESTEVTNEVVSLLADRHCPELVHVGPWEDFVLEGTGQEDDSEPAAQTIRLSTDWIEHREAHGEDRYEPCANVQVVRMRDYSSSDEPTMTLHTAVSFIQAPFRSIATVHGIHQPDAASSSTPSLPKALSQPLVHSLLDPSPSEDACLYAAVVLVPATPPTATDEYLITELRNHVPLIVLPPASQLDPSPHVDKVDTPKPSSNASWSGSVQLSNTEPSTPSELRTALYQNPYAIATLRRESAKLFLRWAGYSAGSIAEALMKGGDDAEGLAVDPDHVSAEREVMVDQQHAEAGESGTVKGWRATRRPDREGFRTTRSSVTKNASRGTGAGTVRGRPRGNTVERRRTITGSTQPRPAIGTLTRLDSFTSSQASLPIAATSPTPLSPSLLSKRRRYAAEHGLSASSTISHLVPSVPPPSFSTFDPLHIPSLVRLALEGLLFTPLRVRLSRLFDVGAGAQDTAAFSASAGAGDDEWIGVGETMERGEWTRKTSSSSIVPAVMIAGAFCAGVGVGVLLARSRTG